MKGLFIGSYPNIFNPYMSVFFKELITQFADLGVECHIISPVSITKYRDKIMEIPKFSIEETKNGNLIYVHYPRTITFSAKKIGRFNTMILTEKCLELASIKTYRKLKSNYDFVYGHFFLGGGLSAAVIARRFGVSAFIAYGEASFESEVESKFTIKKKHMEGVKGLIAVSTKNLEDLEKREFSIGIKKFLSINSVNKDKFYLMNKIECRKKLGLPLNDFIVGYVGYFIERKGSNRLLMACKELEGVSLAFAGKGETAPKGNNVIFCKSLKHEDICIFLNAIDVFALPTLNEGCSNAIIEAMTCKKAIISSDLDFNKDILNENNSILINPNNIKELRDAIVKLRDSETLRETLAYQAFIDSREYSLDKRASNILDFIKANI